MRIETVKLDFKDKAQAKVGSMDNAQHTPGGNRVTVSVSSTLPIHDLKEQHVFERLSQVLYETLFTSFLSVISYTSHGAQTLQLIYLSSEENGNIHLYKRYCNLKGYVRSLE